MKMVSKTASSDKTLRYVALAGAIILYVLIVTGGIVRVTGSGGACPDWPTCFGQWTPPSNQSASIDYLHRLATALAAPIVLAGLMLAWRWFRDQAWIFRPMLVAVGLLVAQVFLGAAITGGFLPVERSWLDALHLLLSLVALGLILVATVIAFNLNHIQEQTGMAGQVAMRDLKPVVSSPFARLSMFTLGALIVLLFSGALVAGSRYTTACSNWLGCFPSISNGDLAAWVNLMHRLMVVVTGFLMGALFLRAWRTQRSQTTILVSTTAAVVLFFAQALLGIKLVAGFPGYLLVLHEATAVAVWVALVVQATMVSLAARTGAQEVAEAAQAVRGKGFLKDFLALTKPIVVLLLLVTTYAGMVIGGRAWPSFWLTFWTLLGGFMAAGGSGAINQYIDRYDDSKMQRTQKRPIPSGRLTAGEGLAFGVLMTLGSFYVMIAFVNLLAAFLTLAGIVYYVLLYSIFLKKTTVQNIVIGGGAGAIPPLVGWAAATGSLNIPSLFLFALVFLWTPPHFWALALVRRKDYARAGVPMLPVIRGERETRWQIFLYTIELVALTLFLPLFGLGGSIYLVGAALLGCWLLMSAWKVWKKGGNKVAWKMYRYSSMYLAFIFLVLMIDRLL
jgi:protoheme IX farnesyltransferase